MLADRLDVPHLEAGALQVGHGGADGGEFTVGEDVGVDELVDVVRRFVLPGAAGDLVVEEPPAGLEQREEVPRVLQVPCGAHVFGHADGGDGVVGPVGDVAVVLHPDLDPVGEALPGDALAGVRRLFLREGHADHAHAELAGRVDRHRTPAAADVEESLPRRQLQLAADEFELVALGVLQRAVRGLPVGARVDHGGAEDEFVEVVADVVVVADGAFVGASGVEVGAAAADLLRGRGGRQRESAELHQSAYGGAHPGVAQGLGAGAGAVTALPDQRGHGVEGRVEVALDVQVPGDPGARHAEFAGLPQKAAQGTAIAYDQGRRIGRPCLGAVPGADAHRDGGPQ